MRFKTLAPFLFCMTALVQNSYAQAPDAVVVVRQSTLNGFLDAVGPVSGKAPYRHAGNKRGVHLDRQER